MIGQRHSENTGHRVLECDVIVLSFFSLSLSLSLSLFFLLSFLTVSSFSSFRSFVFSVGIPKYSEHVLTEFYPMAVAILSRFFL